MKFIIGNWKMNGTPQTKAKMINALAKTETKNRVVLCLPYTLLNGDNRGVKIGAQNISKHDDGAYTGDISGQMLVDSGVKYVIVGHSERRLYHHETDEIVHAKAIAAIKNKIIPIICVGENLAEHRAHKTQRVIHKMLKTALPGGGKFIVAYEPRWAIGTGKTPTMDEIESVHKMIYDYLKRHGNEKTPVLYGGSVNQSNAATIAAIKHVNGLLIGGASLEIKTFLSIIKSIK